VVLYWLSISASEDGVGQVGGQKLRQRKAAGFPDVGRHGIDKDDWRIDAACDGALKQGARCLVTQFVFELRLGQALLFQSEPVGVAAEGSVGSLERVYRQNAPADLGIAHGKAQTCRFVIEGGGPEQLALDLAVKPKGLCLGKADLLAGLGGHGLHFPLKSACIVVHVDVAVADLADGLDGAGKVGDAEAAEAEDQQTKQAEDKGVRAPFAQRAGHDPFLPERLMGCLGNCTPGGKVQRRVRVETQPAGRRGLRCLRRRHWQRRCGRPARRRDRRRG
jgi:hypothetical protein